MVFVSKVGTSEINTTPYYPWLVVITTVMDRMISRRPMVFTQHTLTILS